MTMENFYCLICGHEMKSRDKVTHLDYVCNGFDDHHLSWRMVGDNLSKLRIRFQDEHERLCLQIYYDDKYSEVWSKPGTDTDHRIKVNQIIVPDFTDLEKLKNKIRTILVFG